MVAFAMNKPHGFAASHCPQPQEWDCLLRKVTADCQDVHQADCSCLVWRSESFLDDHWWSSSCLAMYCGEAPLRLTVRPWWHVLSMFVEGVPCLMWHGLGGCGEGKKGASDTLQCWGSATGPLLLYCAILGSLRLEFSGDVGYVEPQIG